MRCREVIQRHVRGEKTFERPTISMLRRGL
jgi:hypothetical protein